MYQSDGACRVEVMDEGRSLAGKALAPSNGWQTATLNFVPPGEALCFCLRFTGSGTFRLDTLRAYADSTAADLADRACEVALAPGRSEIAETRIQFADECAEVRFCVTGEAGGAVLKSCVTDLYGTRVPLAERRDRHQAMLRTLRENDISNWHSRFLEVLHQAGERRRASAA